MTEVNLGRIEARFADLIWAREPLSTAELIALCERELQWKRTTTYTVLKRLCDRGLFQSAGGVVTARMTRADFYAARSERFVDEAFDGSLPAFLAAFTARKDLTPGEIAEIRKLIDACGEG